jgi:hypothetical protein
MASVADLERAIPALVAGRWADGSEPWGSAPCHLALAVAELEVGALEAEWAALEAVLAHTDGAGRVDAEGDDVVPVLAALALLGWGARIPGESEAE